MTRGIPYLLLILLTAVSGWSQVPQVRLEYLETTEGDHIGTFNFSTFCMAKDSTGYLWMGGDRGLYRYDGYELIRFRNEPSDSTSLYNDKVEKLAVTPDGTLWVGLASGLCRLDPVTQSFDCFDILNPTGTRAGLVQDLAVDPKGQLWIAASSGLFRYGPQDETPQRFTIDSLIGRDMNGFIQSLYPSDSGLWMGGRWGMYFFVPETRELREFPYPENFIPHGSDVPYALEWSSRGTFFLATFAGLAEFNPATGEFTHVPIHEGPSFAKQLAVIGDFGPLATDVWEDERGRVWVAYRFLGLVIWDPVTGSVEHYDHNPEDPNTLKSPRVFVLYPDGFGNVWLGTMRGVQRLRTAELFPFYQMEAGHFHEHNFMSRLFVDSKDGLHINTVQGPWFSHQLGEPPVQIPHGGDNPNAARTKDLIGYYEDAQGRVWKGGHRGGLHMGHAGSEKIERIDLSPTFNRSRFACFAPDPSDENVIWVGGGKGVGRYLINSNSFEWIEAEAPFLSRNQSLLRLDPEGMMWSGSREGLYRFDPRSLEAELMHSPDSTDNGLVLPSLVAQIDFDAVNCYAASQRDLIIINRTTGEKIRLGIEQGLPDDHIQSIIVADDGHVWFTTTDHLSRLDPKTLEMKHFRMGASVRQVFQTPAATRLSDGTLLFGGMSGIVAVPPKLQTDRTGPPEPVITSILVQNDKEVPWDNRPDTLMLAHDQNALTLKFNAMHFLDPKYNTYRYRMLPLDQDWVEAGTRHQVTYSNLPHGAYTFEVQAANADGIWSEVPASLRLVVATPFWRSTWFQLLLALVAVVVVVIIWRAVRHQRKLRADRDMAEQRDQYKSKFLANMSHEIRTPLNAIIGMNRLLMDAGITGKALEYSQAIGQSGENLIRIVNDILDQERIEKGKYRIVDQDFRPKVLTTQLLQLFETRAREKNLNMTVDVDPEVPEWVVGDPTRLSQVLINLCGNSLKFTDQGSVDVKVTKVRETEDAVRLRFVVQDTGIGIPKDKLHHIFESFEQVRSADSAILEGTGLGLSIARQLVEQQEGTIKAESEVGVGSTFTVELPYRKTSGQEVQEITKASGTATPQGLRVLLVEDMKLNRMLAIELLKKHFPGVRPEIAENGAVAVELVRSNDFDLVLMDVKMPVMDGYEATRLIREIKAPEALPILAMTANAIPEELQKCLDSGMNDCLVKPIDENALVHKITTLTTPKP